MPKHEFLSPKAIANRMKAKGLQKLRWFCQLCNKQCRDENGFSCHQTSEGHRRMMMVFGSNPGKILHSYSEMFENNFLEELKISHRFSRVHANEFYQKVIKDRYHIHMNSTKWLTLTDFIKHLGSSGMCNVEETDKGLYITLREHAMQRFFDDTTKQERERIEMDTEKEKIRQMRKEISYAESTTKLERHMDTRNLESIDRVSLDRPHEPLVFQLRPKWGGMKFLECIAKKSSIYKTEYNLSIYNQENILMLKKKKEPLFNLENQKKLKKLSLPEEPWLICGTIVLIRSRKKEHYKYYNKKGLVIDIKNSHIAVLKMLDNEDVLDFNQDELETVIPQPGNHVIVLKGNHKGKEAILIEIDLKKFQARLKIGNTTDEWMKYDMFSKFSHIC